MQKEYLMPASILAGCVIIGAGLFFGLRDRQAPPPVATVAPNAPPVTKPTSAPATPPAPQVNMVPGPFGMAVPQAPAEVQAATEAAAKKALEEEKKNVFMPQCYEPALKKQPEPKLVKLVFEMSFDQQGNEVMRGISEDRTAERADVAICLRQLTKMLKISPAPGVPVKVSIPLELP